MQIRRSRSRRVSARASEQASALGAGAAALVASVRRFGGLEPPLNPPPRATELLVWGSAVHLVVDWLGQNEWIADNKDRVAHPAGYVHASAHGAAQMLVFRPRIAAALGAAHLLIDSRRPLSWWSKLVAVPNDDHAAAEIQIWRDQVAHLACIALAALLTE